MPGGRAFELPVYAHRRRQANSALLVICLWPLLRKSECTTGKQRRVSRWEHEEVIEQAEARLVEKPDSMRIRRAVAEHPYGNIKHWTGATHLLTKTRDKDNTEMSLHVLAYNMKRVISLVGTQKLLEAI